LTVEVNVTTLITSLNKTLYDEYGRSMIEGFVDKSIDVKLIIAFEGDKERIDPPKNDFITIIDLKSDDHKYFHKTFGKLYEANGYRLIQQEAPNTQQYKLVHDFRYNFIRFSFKIFSIFAARDILDKHEPFAWIDADLKCLRSFSSENLKQFFPKDNQIMSYLGRTKFPPDAPYSECGFLGFNPFHRSLDEFLNRMKSLYISGEALGFEQWHDSWLWDQTRLEFSQRGNEFLNLSGKYENTEHPFINSGLGKYFDHLKGPIRKKQGHSFSEDYKNTV